MSPYQKKDHTLNCEIFANLSFDLGLFQLEAAASPVLSFWHAFYFFQRHLLNKPGKNTLGLAYLNPVSCNWFREAVKGVSSRAAGLE